MKTLPIIGLVAASLVMGSGMAVAKTKKNKNKGNGHKIEKIQKVKKANKRNKVQTARNVRQHNRVIQHHKPKKKDKFKRYAKTVLKVLRHANGYNNKHIWNNGCVRPHKIRKRLIRRGWYNLNTVNVNPRVIRMRATNFNGRRFVLRVDRCDGYIISRRPVRNFWRY